MTDAAPRLRVVNLGLPKTATSTLSRALRMAGLKTVDHKVRRMMTDDPALQKRFTADLIYRGYFHAGDPLHLLDAFDAFCEISTLRDEASLWPQTDWAVIEAIARHHPGVRFVATWREPFDVSQSMLKWTNMGTERVPRLSVPGLPPGYGETTRERMQWIEGHYAFLDRVFAGDDRYLRLDMAAEDARTGLAAHIGRDVPWWGRENVNDDLDLGGAA